MHTILKKEYTCIITRKKYELVKKRAKDRCILLFCIFETKNQKKKQTKKQTNWKQCFQKVQPQNDKSYSRLYLKKESCLYDINIKRTFSDHNLSDANSLVALPHSETSCRLLFIHVSITDWWFSWYIYNIFFSRLSLV